MIEVTPIGVVKNSRPAATDDDWGSVISVIELLPPLDQQSLSHIEDFSHVEIIFFFDQVAPSEVVTTARHPRSNPQWPKVGILAQRSKFRPNRLGATIARIVEHSGITLTVEGLDAIAGTPVIDIKPVLREFLPRGPFKQPEWATELMKNYWRLGG